ncbi:MAG: hypothetical protein RL097_134 [Candidatus Parcubacteria bacterium]|jgi:hypothetical protein
MRFEVPQFIDVEDKIFGPLSWRQFLYLSGGVGMGVVIFFTTNLIVFLFLGLPLALLAAALAFYPINSRPFSFFLEAIFNYVTKQRLYLWRKKSDVVYKSSTPAKTEARSDVSIRESLSTKKNLTSLARRLELQALQKSE